jgi:hypothetical protein
VRRFVLASLFAEVIYGWVLGVDRCKRLEVEG